MAPLPSFTVTGNLYDLYGNTLADELVDTIMSATVVFTPNLKKNWPFVKWEGNLHRVHPITAQVTADGVAKDEEPVLLFANHPDVIANLQWTVQIRPNGVPGVGSIVGGLKSFPIEGEDGDTVNIGSAAPVAFAAATPITKGAKGDQGFSFAGLEPTEDLTGIQGLRESDGGPVPVGDPVLFPAAGWTPDSIVGMPPVIAAGATAAAARAAIGAVDAAAVTAAVNAVLDGAPGALDTLNELAAALGDDANFAGTITTALATKLSLVQAAKNPDLLVTGAITLDGNDLVTSAAVVWPDGSPGTLTITSRDANNAVLAYNITYGSPVTKTYTQPTITRNANGAATTVPAIVVS